MSLASFYISSADQDQTPHADQDLAVKKSNIMVNNLLLKIFFAKYCHVIADTAIQSYAKNVIFFLKKRMKGFVVYVLEFMLPSDKMQNISPFMYPKFEI